jgi:hypothetical protein
VQIDQIDDSAGAQWWRILPGPTEENQNDDDWWSNSCRPRGISTVILILGYGPTNAVFAYTTTRVMYRPPGDRVYNKAQSNSCNTTTLVNEFWCWRKMVSYQRSIRIAIFHLAKQLA